MDCCNYVQPYAMAGHHFYHQQAMAAAAAAAAAQQHFHHQPQQAAYCYEAPTNAYAPYAGGGAGAAAIEAASARYNNCRLPPAYPTDYVYNPKEARLRKAMREQSRELSRSAAQQQHQQQQQQQQQQQSSSNSSSRLASQQQQQQQAVSPLPGGNSSIGAGGGGGGANRIIGPWFPLAGAPPPATHPKPILSPRVMAAHQRTMDKTKDAMRKQLECSGQAGFPGSNGVSAYHHGDYPRAGTQESGPEYCATGAVSDFSEGQKWHPYQNGANAYHSRSALMSKMSSLHRSMQSATPHPTSAWGQFCNVPFATSQSAMMRSNRHMVFLQEQQSQQHCGYPDEMHMSYETKMQDDLACRLHSSYPQEDQHVKSSLTSVHLGQLTHEEPKLNNGNGCASGQLSCPEDGPRWGTPRPSSVSSSSCTTDTILERDNESQPAQATKSENTKPLPGFQEAFGSTEMGRFSRSELFASLVEAANVSSRSESEQQQQHSAYGSRCSSRRSSSPEPLAGSSYGYGGLGEVVEQQQPTMPRWHSPYAGAIGSEI